MDIEARLSAVEAANRENNRAIAEILTRLEELDRIEAAGAAALDERLAAINEGIEAIPKAYHLAPPAQG